MIKVLKCLFSVVLFGIITISCGISDPSSKFKAKPAALAKMNEIVIITDDDLWNSYIGDTLDYYFSQYYPLTPSPEPTFDLRRFSVGDLNAQPLRRNLRTYLIVANLGDDTSEVTQFVKKDLGEERLARTATDSTFHTSVGKDKWAVGQILIYLFANSMDELAEAIEQNYEGIAAKVTEHDYNQLYEATYNRGVYEPVQRKLLERFGADIKMPGDYVVALDKPEDSGLIWFRKETRTGIMNIAVRQFDYTGPEAISKSSIKRNFNAFGRLYVSSPEEGSYLLLNDVDLPILEYTSTISGRYAKEYRGIWEMENDFMGGPFLSYAIVNEEVGKMIQIDGFILAPGKEKRDMMQQIDLVAKTVRW